MTTTLPVAASDSSVPAVVLPTGNGPTTYAEKWWEGYDKLPPYTSDGSGDYYDKMMLRFSELDRDLFSRTTGLSSQWAKGKPKATDPMGMVTDMWQIRGAVENMLRIHGIPSDTRIEVASLGQVGHGAATFNDIDNFRGARIFLDKTAYGLCEGYELLDVYCGIGLHEASHLEFTRKMFTRLKSGNLKGARAMWEGLLEDERIEQLCRKKSPGFAGYIQAAKRVLFERMEIDGSLAKWDSLPDKDKVRAMLFAFIRCPYLLTDTQRSFRTVSGRRVFAELRKLIDKVPVTEDFVMVLGKRIMDFLASIDAEYKKTADDLANEQEQGDDEGDGEMTMPGSGSVLGGDASGDGTPSDGTPSDSVPGDAPSVPSDGPGKPRPQSTQEIQERLDKQAQADKEDSKFKDFMDNLQAQADKLRNALEESAGDLDAITRAQEDGHVDEVQERQDKLDKIAAAVEAKVEARGDRFGEAEMFIIIARQETVSNPLNTQETGTAAEVKNNRIEMGMLWLPPTTYGSSGDKRRTVVLHPRPEKYADRYKMAHEAVRGHIAKMRSVFSLRIGTRRTINTEQAEGRPHQRMIAKVPVTDRVFFNERVRAAQKFGLCVLLDESASMGSPVYGGRLYGGKGSMAMMVGCLLAEATKKQSGVHLEVYSFTSCGESDKDCRIQALYTPKNPDARSIGAYGSDMGCNYDCQAIKETGKIFLGNTPRIANRLMIVVSDGTPNGENYGGQSAEKSVKTNVEELRRKGVHVIQVAITGGMDHDSHYMYGKENVISFTDLDNLVRDMRKLIQRYILKTTIA